MARQGRRPGGSATRYRLDGVWGDSVPARHGVGQRPMAPAVDLEAGKAIPHLPWTATPGTSGIGRRNSSGPESEPVPCGGGHRSRLGNRLPASPVVRAKAVWLAEHGWRVTGGRAGRRWRWRREQGARRAAERHGDPLRGGRPARLDTGERRDLVAVVYLQLPPRAARRLAHRRRRSGARGTLVIIGHDSSNLTEGTAARKALKSSTPPTRSWR